jgi:hypothetical protein
MARKIADLNSSDSGLMEELTDEELLEINGGGLLGNILRGAKKLFRGVKIPFFSGRF